TNVQFTLPEDSYSNNQVQVRTSDEAGNISAIFNLGALKIDSTAPVTSPQNRTLEVNNANATNGVSLFEHTISSYSTDIYTINITIGGTGLDTTNDQIVLDTEQNVGSDFSVASAVNIGGVSVIYNYNSTTKKLDIKKSDGSDFTRDEITSIENALKYKIASSTASDGQRTFSLTFEDRAGNVSNSSTTTINGNNLSIVALVIAVAITSISADTGVYNNDYVTNDSDGLTINGTINAALGANEILEYSKDNGITWSTINNSSIANNGDGTYSFSHTDNALTSDATIKVRVRNTVTSAESLEATQLIDIDTTSVDVDLSSTNGTQTTDTTTMNSTEAISGKIIFEDIQSPAVDDIVSINITVGGSSLDTTNDAIVLNAEHTLDSDFNSSNVTVGGVSVDYSFVATTKILTITRNGSDETFTSEEVQNIQKAILFKTTSNVEGDREFTISYTDVANNTGATATQTVNVDFTVPTISSASVVVSLTSTGYDVIDLPAGIFGGSADVLNTGENVDITSYIPDGMTATEFFNALISMRVNWGGKHIAGGGVNGNAVSSDINATYQTLDGITSGNTFLIKFTDLPFIKGANVMFTLSTDGSTLTIRNVSAQYDQNELPYENTSLDTNYPTGDYGLTNIKLYYQKQLNVVDTSPDVDVTYEGTNAKVGDTIKLYEGNTLLATYTLTASNVGAGNHTVRLSSIISLSEGVHNLTVKYEDTAGNESTLNSSVQFTAGAEAGQPSNMKITGLRATETGVEQDQLLDSNNYLSTSGEIINLYGVQDSASFITVEIDGKLLYANNVSKGSFELEIANQWVLAPGVYDVVVTSTNSNTGVVTTQTFKMGWFNGGNAQDTITGSAYDDHIAPDSSGNGGVDTITTGDGNDTVYLRTIFKSVNTNNDASTYVITDFTIGKDKINANDIVSNLSLSNISGYASISYNSNGDA
ncbi:beta strand repeat-containing protein, partial [Poseidonibacter ostreae]|uniref:beta strand repeat-containing protein n=1 Tax=Poseidonibacter ostreae TaxID=2654171 RepID=UPI00186ABDEF